MFSGARLYDSCVVTRTGAGTPCFSLSRTFFLSLSLIPLPVPPARVPATLKPTSMAILRRFLRCQVPLLLWGVVRVCGILGWCVYLRHGAFAARGSRYGRIFLRNVVRSPYKGRLRGFMAFLASLIRSQIKGYDDAYSWIRRFKYENDISEMNHEINECALRGFSH